MNTSNPFIISATANQDLKILEEWTYPARCYQVIDLWTHHGEYQGVAWTRRKIRVAFEFPTELAIFSPEKWEQPFMLSRQFTFSMHENGQFRPFLESWRGKKFTEEELEGFDVSKLLGATALIQVSHEVGKDGKNRANIQSIMTLPKGMDCPDSINAPILFSPVTWDDAIFSTLPKSVQTKIAESDEGIARGMNISVDDFQTE